MLLYVGSVKQTEMTLKEFIEKPKLINNSKRHNLKEMGKLNNKTRKIRSNN